MELDFWAEYYSRRPTEYAFDNDNFEADVAKMMNDDEAWEDVPMRSAPDG